LLATLPDDSVVLPVQVLGELYRILVGKAKWPADAARNAVLTWRDTYPALDTTESVMIAALDLAVDHRLSPWDAVVLAAAAEAGCRVLLSEDLQEGFTWRGLTVVNPLSPAPHPLLATVLAAGRGS
jgi:predicted nucleic acid-binding protein